MTNPKHKSFGIPLDQWIATIPNELEFDAVGLWQIIPTFRDAFGLSGEELTTATRQALRGLLSAGALPVIASSRAGEDWEFDDSYGTTASEIEENIVTRWLSPNDPPDLGDVWFALLD
jgi:hypothetical protein